MSMYKTSFPLRYYHFTYLPTYILSSFSYLVECSAFIALLSSASCVKFNRWNVDCVHHFQYTIQCSLS